jgi:thymidylate synthase
MAKIDKEYHKLLNNIVENGFKYEDPNRKGVNRIQVPSYTIKHDFKDGFPAITTKKLYWKGVVGELIWFLRGDTNIKYLVDNGINIWNKDAYNYYCKECKVHNVDPCEFDKFILFIKNGDNSKNHFIPSKNNYKLGDLGRVYGYQLRNFGGKFDQLKWIIDTMKNNPMATKKTVTFINPNDKEHQALTPCHTGFKILVEPIRYINVLPKATDPIYQFTLQWEQDSVDTFLGLPFNIASYALLAQIIGKITNMKPKGIIGDLSNVHIYEPHLDAVKEQLSRATDIYEGKTTKVVHFHDLKEHYESKGLDDLLNSLDINENFVLKNYNSYPRIPAEMLAYNK